MTTGKKISLIYSAITLLLVMVVGVVCYVVFSRYTERVYFNYLEEKAHAVAAERFERDELPPEKFAKVVEMRKTAIPTSKEVFVNTADTAKARPMLRKYLSEKQIYKLFKGDDVDFRHGDEVGTAFVYNDNEGIFVVMVLSHNPYLSSINHAMGWMLLLMFVVSALILWLVSRLYAMRMVERIDNDYKAEKMFVNNASHEINNPLTAIQGECEIALLKERSGEEYRKSLGIIQKETDRVVRIMKQLLQFSHTRSEKIDKSTLDEIHIGEFLQQFANDTVTVHVEENFTVMAKEDLLTIAFRNLINNACKYSDGKPVDVFVENREVKIVDHGMGISKDDLPHIFEPFYRASNTIGIAGHGIGLSLANEILRKYGFKVMVESEVGHGTAFTIMK